MATAGIILIPLLFFLGLVLMAVIPVVVALIYRGSYNRHLNEQLNGQLEGTQVRRWISPLALGLIIFLVEVILVVGITVIGMVRFSAARGSGSVDFGLNNTSTYTDEDVPEEITVFDGSDVDGYLKLEGNDGDFHYTAYKLDSGKEIQEADYVLCIDYNGDSKASEAYASATFDISGSGSALGAQLNASDRYYAVIDVGTIVLKDIITKDGKEITQETTVKPTDIEIQYDLVLLDLPTVDGDSMDFESMTDDTMVAECHVDVTDLKF